MQRRLYWLALLLPAIALAASLSDLGPVWP
jgi:hypothetical protein